MGEPTADERRLISIGEAAELLQMTTRTLRYYEELGLVASERSSNTSQRRYGPDELKRLEQIKELQTLLGLDLDEIGEQLATSDRLEGLRQEYHSGAAPERREEIVSEGLAILERLRERVAERQERLAVFAEELDERIGRYLEAQRRGSRATRPAGTAGATERRPPPARSQPRQPASR